MRASLPGGPASAGRILELVRAGRVRTRRELQDATGLSRSTLALRMAQLTLCIQLPEAFVHQVLIQPRRNDHDPRQHHGRCQGRVQSSAIGLGNIEHAPENLPLLKAAPVS